MESPCLANIRNILSDRDSHRQWGKEENHKSELLDRPINTTSQSEISDRQNPVETIVVVPELNVGLHPQSEDEEVDNHHQNWRDQDNSHPMQELSVPVKTEAPHLDHQDQMMQKCFEDCKIAAETLNNCKAEDAGNTLQNWSQPIGHIDPIEKSYSSMPFTSCPSCEFTSSDAKEFKEHINSHSTEKTYNCKVCGYSCPGPWKLKRHMQVHSDDKLHCCDLCDYSCSEAWRLKRHVKVHTGDRSHSCPICGYTGPDSWKLKRHMRIHTGEKPYRCTSCDYCSGDAWKVKRHMRVHTGKKPY